jgi:hypothetical protein
MPSKTLTIRLNDEKSTRLDWAINKFYAGSFKTLSKYLYHAGDVLPIRDETISDLQDSIRRRDIKIERLESIINDARNAALALADKTSQEDFNF